jgi:hypothetical protein
LTGGEVGAVVRRIIQADQWEPAEVASGTDVDPLDDLRDKINTFGWAVRDVSDRDAAKCLSYTVGLTAHGHPEVVMTGLPPEIGNAFLNIAGESVVRDGGRFAAGDVTTELSGRDCFRRADEEDRQPSPPAGR